MAKSVKKTSNIRETRESAAIFGLGAGITELDEGITGCRLPTNEQVIRCYMFHRNEGSAQGTASNRTKRDNAKIVLDKIIPFYLKGSIPMISEKSSCQKIVELVEKNAKLREIPVNRRSTTAVLAKLKAMENDLQKTFPLWTRDAEKVMKSQEDIKFLMSMKTDRVASFGVHDKALASQIKRKESRTQKHKQYKEKAEKEIEVASQTVQLTDSESGSDEDVNADDLAIASTSQAKTHHRVARPGTAAFIPHDILKSPKLVSLATRMKLSPAEQAAYTEAIIEESGGDKSKISISYATADRSRRKVGEKIATAVRETWKPPKLASLHWDSKLMGSLTNKNVNEERLTVAVGNINEIKLLGVPAYKPGTDKGSGDIITEKSMELLRLWHCEDSIVSMVFDTTASNTGHVSAACIRLQEALERPLLWAACRHHVGEVILTQVFTDLNIEASRSPEVSLFSRFRKHFDSVCRTNKENLKSFDSSSYSEEINALVEEWRSEAVQLAKTSMNQKRDDYKEFAELCVLFLDDSSFTDEFIFKRPGALHKARWMAKLLYSAKIVLLEENIRSLPAGTITSRQQTGKLRDFVTFISLIYSSWWNTCTIAVDAPWNDLCLFKKCLLYKAVNSTVSKSAVAALSRHLWYLTAEMVPLALFSDLTPSVERQNLAARLLEVRSGADLPRDRFGTGFGKPRFPTKLTPSTTLAELVGVDSWFMFNLLHLESDFLIVDVDQWTEVPSFVSSKSKIDAINVINDCAERGVKLSSDFLTGARSEEHFQNILQVVETDRKNKPNLRKGHKRKVTD
jgi:hypothetical protein